MQNKSIHYGY